MKRRGFCQSINSRNGCKMQVDFYFWYIIMEDLIVLLKVLDLLHDFFENFGAVLCSAFHSDCDPKGTHCCGKQGELVPTRDF